MRRIKSHYLISNLVQSYSNQNYVVVAWRQTYRLMERIESLEINPYVYGQITLDEII